MMVLAAKAAVLAVVHPCRRTDSPCGAEPGVGSGMGPSFDGPLPAELLATLRGRVRPRSLAKKSGMFELILQGWDDAGWKVGCCLSAGKNAESWPSLTVIQG
jgi:hypothetical protein